LPVSGLRHHLIVAPAATISSWPVCWCQFSSWPLPPSHRGLCHHPIIDVSSSNYSSQLSPAGQVPIHRGCLFAVAGQPLSAGCSSSQRSHPAYCEIAIVFKQASPACPAIEYVIRLSLGQPPPHDQTNPPSLTSETIVENWISCFVLSILFDCT
jgi:hypothetical protein